MCDGGRFIFHEQCVGAIAGTDEGLSFDTLANQVKRNGDSGESILLKMDIEGAEWDSLLATSDEGSIRVSQRYLGAFQGFSWVI